MPTRRARVDVPGGYAGLPVDTVGFGALARYLAGGSGIWPGGGRVALLGCDCGEPGCRPLLARVQRTAGTVGWDGLENPHRPAADPDR